MSKHENSANHGNTGPVLINTSSLAFNDARQNPRSERYVGVPVRRNVHLSLGNSHAKHDSAGWRAASRTPHSTVAAMTLATNNTPMKPHTQGFNMAGRKGRSGAPKGNTNGRGNMKSGLRAHLRYGLKAGTLPANCRYISNRLNALRRCLEDAITATWGEIDLQSASLVQSIIRHEMTAQLCMRWLRLEGDTLSPLERLKYADSISKASKERDACIGLLELSTESQHDPWSVLNSDSDEGDSDEQA